MNRPANQQSATTTLSADRRTLTVRIPVSFRNHRAGKQIISPDGAPEWSAHRLDDSLIRAIVRAHHWRTLLESGRYTSAAELAKAEKVNDSYVSRLLRLTLLAPDIVEAILNGKQPRELELKELLKQFPSSWTEQRAQLGFVYE